MDSNNESQKRSSLSSRASKIPQKLVQSSTLLFSVRASMSSSRLSTNEGFTKKIGSMVFGPRGSSSLSAIQQPKSLDILESDKHFSKLTHRHTFDGFIDQIVKSNDSNDYTPYSTTPEPIVYTIHDLKEMIQKELESKDWEALIKYTNLLLKSSELDPLEYSEQDSLLRPDLLLAGEKVQQVIQSCLSISTTMLSIPSEIYLIEETKIYLNQFTSQQFEAMSSDQIVSDATWFRHHFAGKDYLTLICSSKIKKNNKKQNTKGVYPSIISIIQEKKNGLVYYRIIIRNTQTERHIVSLNQAKEMQAKLEIKGEGHTTTDQNRRLLLPSFKNDSTKATRRLMRAAIQSVYSGLLDSRSFKEISAKSTRSSGLENGLITYDELQIPKHYKFGLLTIEKDQITEESWFSNTGISDDLRDFLNIMGHKVQLKGYKGFAAGLDTKTDESGSFAYVSKWKEYDIAFHVSALMPLKANDEQQVLRKSHIGNDIVCIIFIEGNQLFDPTVIQSQFLHVYIIVHPEYKENKRHWRIEVIRHKSVQQFNPYLPSPPLFDDQDLKSFLTLKLVSAENAALKADKFSIPNDRARLSLLSDHIKTGLSFPTETNVETKSRLLHKANNSKQDWITASSVDIPLVTPSRSTLLHGLKKGFSKKKETGLYIGQDIHVSTQSFMSNEHLFSNNVNEQDIGRE